MAAPAGDALLRVRGLSLARAVGRHGAARVLLHGLDFSVRGGEVVMLMGPNGAGKSTLLAALAGDLPPAAGQVLLHGRAPRAWRPRELARRRAMLPQRPGLNAPFLAGEVVRLGCWARDEGRATIDAVVAAALCATGAEALADRVVPALSGGEQARVHLARVLAQVWPAAPTGGWKAAPPCLLLDEPCASLDPAHQHAVCAQVRAFARDAGAAVVMSMHDINLAVQYADRLLVLAGGRLAHEGTPAQVLSQGAQTSFGVRIACWRPAEQASLAATQPPA
ncbi:MAG: ATP-binding cassette domain-containing protein [Xenophilus sp.]